MGAWAGQIAVLARRLLENWGQLKTMGHRIRVRLGQDHAGYG